MQKMSQGKTIQGNVKVMDVTEAFYNTLMEISNGVTRKITILKIFEV